MKSPLQWLTERDWSTKLRATWLGEWTLAQEGLPLAGYVQGETMASIMKPVTLKYCGHAVWVFLAMHPVHSALAERTQA